MQNIDQIFKELLELEPSLREKGTEVKKIISLMLETNPQVRISPEFKNQLRQRVLSEITKNSYVQHISSFTTFLKYFTPFAAGGALVYGAMQFAILPDFQGQKIDSSPIIIEKQERAFGDLKSLGLSDQSQNGNTSFEANPQNNIKQKSEISGIAAVNTPQTVTSNIADIKNVITVEQTQQATDTSPAVRVGNERQDEAVSGENMLMDTAVSSGDTLVSEPIIQGDMPISDIDTQFPKNPSISIAPSGVGTGGMTEPGYAPGYFPGDEYIPTEFVFDVTNIELPKYAEKMSVYKIERQALSATNLSQIFGTSQMDFSILEKPRIEYLSLYEDKKDGYYINYDVNSAALNFSMRYTGGMEREENMASQSSVKQLTLDQMLKIAQSFFTKYGIDVNSYATPKLQQNYGMVYSAKISGEPVWYDDNATLIYQKMLDGYEIYDIGGYPVGMYATISQSKKQITALGPIEKQTLSQSLYTTETSKEKIQSQILKKNQSYYDPSQKVHKVTLSLGNAALVYVKIYSSWSDTDGTYGVYYVPALKFNIKDKPQEYYSDSVIVPLVKDFYEENLYPSVEPYSGVSGGTQEGSIGEAIDFSDVQ